MESQICKFIELGGFISSSRFSMYKWRNGDQEKRRVWAKATWLITARANQGWNLGHLTQDSHFSLPSLSGRNKDDLWFKKKSRLQFYSRILGPICFLSVYFFNLIFPILLGLLGFRILIYVNPDYLLATFGLLDGKCW